MAEEAGAASGAANAPAASGTMLQGSVDTARVIGPMPKLKAMKAKYDFSNVSKKKKAGTSKTNCSKNKKKKKDNKKKPVQQKPETPKTPPPAKPAAPKFDTSKFPGQFGRGTMDAWANDPNGFPKLKGGAYEVLQEANANDHSPKNHNCIDDSVGDTSKRIPPQTGPKANPFGPMDKIYKDYGYTPHNTTDWNSVAGKNKVVLFGTKNPDGSIKVITHAIRQMPDGTWRSKMGYGPLVRIGSPNDLNGVFYGLPVRVYTK